MKIKRKKIHRRKNPRDLAAEAGFRADAALIKKLRADSFLDHSYRGGEHRFHLEIARLQKDAQALSARTLVRHTREANAIADRYDKAHPPLGRKATAAKAYKPMFALGYKVKKGIGTEAEYQKLFKKFPSRMTYAILPPPSEAYKDAMRRATRHWEKYAPDEYDPAEVHRRASWAGATLRKQSLAGKERREDRLALLTTQRNVRASRQEMQRPAGMRHRAQSRRLPLEHRTAPDNWWEEHTWSADGSRITGRRKNPRGKMTRKEKSRLNKAAWRKRARA